MQVCRLAACLFAFCIVGCGNSIERVSAAREVLAAMRFGETLELSKRHPLDTGARSREALNRCYRETDTAPVVERLAQVYADAFTRDELLELKTFYLSATGARAVRKDIEDGYRRRRLTPPDRVELSGDDARIIDAFASSPLARKLRERSLQESIATVLREAEREMLQKCESQLTAP